MELKEILDHLKNGVNSEVKGAKKLEGDKLTRFCEIFNVPEDINLFYSDYNLIITDEDAYNHLDHFINKKNIIMEVKIKSYNVFLIVYEYISDALFDNYLNDPEIEE